MQSNEFHQIYPLFRREVRAEWKNRFAVYSLVLLMVISVFVVYSIDKVVPNQMWHSYFYLLLIFGVVQNIGRSFLSETSGQHLYLKTVAGPRAVLAAKMLYQMAVNLLFLLLLYVLLHFFLDHSIPHPGSYLVTALLFTLSNVVIFTFNAAIAAQVRNSGLVASVLSFPLLIPNLLVGLHAASRSLDATSPVLLWQDWGVMVLLFLMSTFLGLILFRYVWQD